MIRIISVINKMEDIVSTREKVMLQKFISAEDERLAKKKIKDQIEKNKQENFLKFQENSKKLNELQEKFMEEFNKNKQREVLRTVKEKTTKLHESIMLHRKVIKQLIEQEAKFIRKPKRSVSKMDRLPYLKKFRKNFIESVNISDNEEDNIEVSKPQLIPMNMKALKIKSVTPVPTKAKVNSHNRSASKY